MTEPVKTEYLELAKRSAAFAELRRGVDFEAGHAFLILSPDVVFARALFYALAATVKCADVCLACKSCRRITSGRCLDIVDFTGAKMMTADIEKVTDGVAYAPYELPYKIHILDLTDTADVVQNKLLTTLEQPPPAAKFLLIATSRSSLLPTVLSRCNVFTPSLTEGELATVNFDGSPNLPYARYGANGSLTEFESILFGQTTEYLICAINAVETLYRSADMVKVLKYLPTGEKNARIRLKKTFGYMERIYGDIMKAHVGYYADTQGLFSAEKLCAKVPLSAIPPSLAALRRATERSAAGNLSSVVDELVLKLTEVIYNAQSSGN